MGNLHLLADHPKFSGGRIRIQSVLDQVTEIVRPLPCAGSFHPVLSAARDGVLAETAGELYFYLYGAVHACGVDEEIWQLLDEQLDRLRR